MRSLMLLALALLPTACEPLDAKEFKEECEFRAETACWSRRAKILWAVNGLDRHHCICSGGAKDLVREWAGERNPVPGFPIRKDGGK